MTKIKILDASGPPGLPSLLPGGSNAVVVAAISALSFSPDGEVRYTWFSASHSYPFSAPDFRVGDINSVLSLSALFS